MRPVRSHSFRGRRWRVKFKRLRGFVGLCDPPREPAKEILIDSRQDGLELLDTAIHEALHASLWDLDEAAIDETARDLARFLWRLGWRRG